MFPEVLIPKSTTVAEAMGPMRNTQHLTSEHGGLQEVIPHGSML